MTRLYFPDSENLKVITQEVKGGKTVTLESFLRAFASMVDEEDFPAGGLSHERRSDACRSRTVRIVASDVDVKHNGITIFLQSSQ